MMDEEVLSQYISIGSDSYEDAEAIFKLTINYLNELKGQKYQAEYATLVEGLINKMLVICESFELAEDFRPSFESNLNHFTAVISEPSSSSQQRILHFNKVYSDVLKFYNAFNKLKPKSSISIGPFKPDNCDKLKITSIMYEVIEIIKKSTYLKDKLKDSIIEKLTQVINELNHDRTDWGIYFKNIGNTIVLLSALASLVTDSITLTQLNSAKDKLQEANTTIERTSLTFSNKDIKEVFVVDDIILINNPVTIQLGEDIQQKLSKLNKQKQ